MGTMGLFLELGISSGAIVAGLLAGPLGLAGTFVAVAAVPVAGLILAAATGARRPVASAQPLASSAPPPAVPPSERIVLE